MIVSEKLAQLAAECRAACISSFAREIEALIAPTKKLERTLDEIVEDARVDERAAYAQRQARQHAIQHASNVECLPFRRVGAR